MKTKQYISKKRIFKITLLATTFLLTACAGQQAAQELAGLEISTMMEYKQAIDNTISNEDKYYKDALAILAKNLNEMKKPVTRSTLAHRALVYDDRWHKSPPSQLDVLTMIDAVYTDYEKTDKDFDSNLKQINEQYFSKIEKLTLEQDNINKSIAALTKLYAGDELKEQAGLLKKYITDTAKSISEATDNNK